MRFGRTVSNNNMVSQQLRGVRSLALALTLIGSRAAGFGSDGVLFLRTSGGGRVLDPSTTRWFPDGFVGAVADISRCAPHLEPPDGSGAAWHGGTTIE